MANQFGPNDLLRTSGVLRALRADKISLIAKRDKLICEVARRYLNIKEKHLSLVARGDMRRLARLVQEVGKIENDNHPKLISILHPLKFKVVIEATRIIADYNYTNKTFKTPSLALQIGTLLKRAITAAYSIELQKDLNSSI